MSKSGEVLAGDLSELRAVAQVDLGNLARDYSKMNHKVAGTSDHDTVAFSYHNFGLDQVAGPWTGLRTRLQDFLGKSANRFDAASGAIMDIVHTYAATDSEAARDLHTAWEEGPPSDLSNKWDRSHPVDGKMKPPIISH